MSDFKQRVSTIVGSIRINHSRVRVETAREMERQRRIDALADMYDTIEDMRGAYTEDNILDDLGIKVEKLNVTGDSGAVSGTQSFFEPLYQSTLDENKLASDKETIADRDCGLIQVMNRTDIDTADCLGCELAFRATYLPRSGPLKERNTERTRYAGLSGLRKWRIRDGLSKCMLDAAFHYQTFYSEHPRYSPVHAWEFKNREEKPHLMLSLKHGIAHEDKILRGELLTILAIMQSRMPWPMFKDHVIVPIMLFSFIGHSGRIIQAHYNGHTLVLCKSNIFRFLNGRTAVYNMDHFVRYVASAPEGDTRSPSHATTAEQARGPDGATASPSSLPIRPKDAAYRSSMGFGRRKSLMGVFSRRRASSQENIDPSESSS
ncbi:hypothetical protein BDV37DRAFT_282352 [Aspergillus pseudonomiae]|uniref:Uncharacterized protein n=1 Tax=Aspergillus pseudonomiae TaxID=1506151 RepID=A0A5N7DED1_9EURO|nr:uncharacterized protein BDV37DRAFT_282352 [Aspergillus pseudonomiae]KAE8404816.1 hypothetical protein BDV37DRAFT_282352 [Aspergillus pseudonomiae]